MQLKICGSHFTCKVADNYERNPDRKKIPQNLDSKKANDIYGIEIMFW